MSKVAIRVIQDSKHVGTVPRRAIAEAVRKIGSDSTIGKFALKRESAPARRKR